MQGTLQMVTSSRAAMGGMCASRVREVPTQPLPLTGHETGRDLCPRVFLLTAAGECCQEPAPLPHSGAQADSAKKRVSRRKKGSKRHAQAAAECAKQQHVRQQRRDF